MPTSTFLVRRGTIADRPALERLEKAFFPAIPGQHHSGYSFEDVELTAALFSLPESGPAHLPVAEVGGEVVGFAFGNPYSLPGTGQMDHQNALLMHVAVDEEFRRQGVGAALIQYVESFLTHQDVFVAHIPAGQRSFYENLGWTVVSRGRGFAWLPRSGILRADLPDAALGYPHMAYKMLKPQNIRKAFTFSKRTGRPVLDAAVELKGMLDAGQIERSQLDEVSLKSVEMIEQAGPPPAKGAFGQSLRR